MMNKFRIQAGTLSAVTSFSLLFSVASANALTADELRQCEQIREPQIIEAAISKYIEISKYFKQNEQNKQNSYIYENVSDFMKLNPNCCDVLDVIPGDFPDFIQDLGRNKSHIPIIYAVRVRFREKQNGVEYIHTTTKLIHCLGFEISEAAIRKIEE